MAEKAIEYPAHGTTYHHDDRVGVYEYDRYPQGSVLAGQSRRKFLGFYFTIQEAADAHPDAVVRSTTYANAIANAMTGGYPLTKVSR